MTEPKEPKTYDQLMEEAVRDMEEKAAAVNAEPAAPVKPKRKFRPSKRFLITLGAALINLTSLLLFITAAVLALIGDLTTEALFFGMVGLFNMSQWGLHARR